MPPPPLSAVIESAELTVRVGNRTVLDGVTAEIAGNCITVLLGRTGSGKSAFLNSAAGILPRHGGSLLVLGRDPLNRREACQIRKSCGIVPQNKALYGNYTVAEMCRLCKAFYPNWQTHLETRLLDRFELVPRHRVSQLSHTQRALLSATLALAHLPPLLLLDEPFDELDPHAAQSLLQALIEAAGEASATVVIATNNPERVEAVADHALFFSSGKVVLSSSTDEIARSWRLITAHFPAETVLSSLPVSSVEYMRGDGSRVEWVVSDHAAESASIVQSLGALSVRVESLTLYTLFSRFLN